ncbi:MAG: hypothetical protein ABH840_01195 [Nanoarchaeota archaeon]
MGKRGLSSVITVVLLIGVVLVAFLIVYNSIILVTKDSTGRLESDSNSFIQRLAEWTSGYSEPLPPNLAPSLDGTVEGCYISLEINETKVGEELDENGYIISQDIEFGLLNQENLYGAYESHVNNYDSEMGSDYLIITYDSSGNLLSNYSVYSGRFIFYDTFNNETGEASGGMFERNSSVLFEVLPYDERIELIEIHHNEIVTNLNINPSEFECVRTCKIENEVLGDDEECCIGLIQGNNDTDSVCADPNDGVCSEFEDADSCLGDCFDDTKCLYEGCMNFTCFGDDYVRNESGCGCDLKPWCHAADFDGDNDVDLTDLNILTTSWGNLASCKTTGTPPYGDSCCYASTSSYTYITLKRAMGSFGTGGCRQDTVSC